MFQVLILLLFASIAFRVIKRLIQLNPASCKGVGWCKVAIISTARAKTKKEEDPVSKATEEDKKYSIRNKLNKASSQAILNTNLFKCNTEWEKNRKSLMNLQSILHR